MVWTCEELRVKQDQTRCYLRPLFRGTHLVPSRVGGSPPRVSVRGLVLTRFGCSDAARAVSYLLFVSLLCMFCLLCSCLLFCCCIYCLCVLCAISYLPKREELAGALVFCQHLGRQENTTANLRTKILDFRGFDSSRILCVQGLEFSCP